MPPILAPVLGYTSINGADFLIPSNTLPDLPEKGIPREMKPPLALKEASLCTGVGINKLRGM